MAAGENEMTQTAELNRTQVSATLIRSVLAYCEALGLDRSTLLGLIAVSENDLLNPDGYFDESFYDLLLHHSAELSRNPFFGLELGENLSLRQLGILGFLVMNSENVREAVRAYEKYQTAFGESLEMKVEFTPTVCRIRLRCHGGQKSARHRVESFISSFRSAAFELTGRELQFQDVHMKLCLSGHATRYQKSFGVIPKVSDEDYFDFSVDFLNLPVVNSSPELNSFFEQKIIEQVENKSAQSFSRTVKREITRRLGKDTQISLSSVAKEFGVSERSMQTKLQDEGATFRELQEQVLKDFATGFLKAGRPIAEISYVLGFSEPAAFHRAFKRWTGESPAQFRSSK